MKKEKIKIIAGMGIVIVSISILIYLQYGRSMEVYSSNSSNSSNYHEKWLTVVINRLYIFDKEKCAKEIVRKCRENDFRKVMFSYDKSIPNALYVTVYLSEWEVKHGKPVFTISYTQESLEDGYNIVDNPQHFRLKIK